jgi:hypothetical protein
MVGDPGDPWAPALRTVAESGAAGRCLAEGPLEAAASSDQVSNIKKDRHFGHVARTHQVKRGLPMPRVDNLVNSPFQKNLRLSRDSLPPCFSSSLSSASRLRGKLSFEAKSPPHWKQLCWAWVTRRFFCNTFRRSVQTSLVLTPSMPSNAQNVMKKMINGTLA